MNYNYFKIDEGSFQHKIYKWQYNYGDHKYIIRFNYEKCCQLKSTNCLGAISLIASPTIKQRNKISIKFGPRNMVLLDLARDTLIGSFKFDEMFSIVTFNLQPNTINKIRYFAIPTEMLDALLEFYKTILAGNEKELVRKIDYNINCRTANKIDDTIKDLALFSEWLKREDNDDYSRDLLGETYKSLENANAIIYNYQYYFRSKF